MLNSHSDITIPNESWFLLELVKQLPLDQVLSRNEIDLAHRIISQHPRFEDWETDTDDLKARLQEIENPRLSSVIEIAFVLECGKDTLWGDKTPGYIDIMPELHQLFPRAKFIHIIRDGRDVCISLLEKKWRGSESWTIARYWRDAVNAARLASTKMPSDQYLEVKYEELVVDSESVLTNLCNFLDRPFNNQMLDFHQQTNPEVLSMQDKHHRKTTRPPQTSDLARWRTELSPKKIAMVESIIGPTLAKFDYERHFKGLRAAYPKYLSLILFLAEVSLPLRKKLGIHFPKAREKF